MLTANQLIHLVALQKPGSTVSMQVKRGDKVKQLDVTIGTRPPVQAKESSNITPELFGGDE